MADATCSNCPWWEMKPDQSDVGRCHHGSVHQLDSVYRDFTWWCSEHPLRQRDRIAEMAMQGLCADPNIDSPPKQVAEAAYKVADAMLAERAKGTP